MKFELGIEYHKFKSETEISPFDLCLTCSEPFHRGNNPSFCSLHGEKKLQIDNVFLENMQEDFRSIAGKVKKEKKDKRPKMAHVRSIADKVLSFCHKSNFGKHGIRSGFDTCTLNVLSIIST